MSKPLPLGRSLLLSLVLALGVAFAWGVAMLWVVFTATSDTSVTIEQIYLRRNGEPVILRYVEGVSRGVFTLDGEPIEADPYGRLSPDYVYDYSRFAGGLSIGWRSRLAAANDRRQPPTFWYLVHNGQASGRAYGVGFDSASKRIVGYFGRRGFSETLPPQSDWFPIAGDSGLWGATPNVSARVPNFVNMSPFFYILAGEKVWSVDLRRRDVKPLLNAPWAKTIGWAWSLPEEAPLEPSREPMGFRKLRANRKLLIRANESAAIVDPKSGETFHFPLPEEVGRTPVAAIELGNGNILLISMDDVLATDASISRRKLLWLNSGGKILKQRTVELASPSRGPDSLAAIGWTVLLAEPMPLASGLLTFLYPLSATIDGTANSYSKVLTQMFAETWPSMLVALLIGVLTAIAAYRRQRRFGLPHARAWAIFTFIFGVPGWLGYRFHRRWPPLDECPTCGQLAPRDRDTCQHCDTVFPPPALLGNEVFA